MTSVEQAGYLRGLPAQPLGELALIETGSAHRPIGLEFGRGQGRQRDDWSPLRWRRWGYVFVMRHPPEDHLIEQILGLGERLITGLALAPAVGQVGEIDDEAPLLGGDQIDRPSCEAGYPFHPSSFHRSRTVKPSCLRTPCNRPVFSSPLPVGTWVTRWPRSTLTCPPLPRLGMILMSRRRRSRRSNSSAVIQ